VAEDVHVRIQSGVKDVGGGGQRGTSRFIKSQRRVVVKSRGELRERKFTKSGGWSKEGMRRGGGNGGAV